MMYEDPGFYNADCMEAMKEFPDKFFDLAIVDPPYGGANSDIGGGRRFGQRFDRYKTPLYIRTAKEGQELSEPAGHGRENTQKNCFVGHRPGAGVF